MKRLLPEETNAQYIEPGYVMFGRGSKLMAQPFDAGRLRITGGPFLVAQEILDVNIWNLSATAFSGSGGVLAYRTGRTEGHRLRWFDRKGSQLGDVGLAGDYWDPALSPDGHAVAVSMRMASAWEIWVFDLVRGTRSRLMFGGGNRYNPNWSPAGRQIAFRFLGASRSVIHRVLANGAGKEETGGPTGP
jgi:dipeptidyl aminopeptidase/acylaminoacyl peptidase